MAVVGQLMDQRRIAMESKDNRLILGEQHVIFPVT